MGKHSSGKYAKNKKVNIKIVGILIAIILVITCIVIFMYNRTNSKTEPEKYIENLFTTLKNANREEASKYIDYEKLISSLDEMLLNKDSAKMSNIEKKLFKDLKWNIENVEVQDNQATIIVEMTNKNFANIITTWIKEILKEKEQGMTISNELAIEKLEKVIDEEKNTKTILKKISLNKEDDWKIVVNDDLRDLIFPGIDSVETVLNEL